jgi:diguanylate cyclase (GGDEF)-like protein
MLSLTRTRLAVGVLATVGLVAFTVLLLAQRGSSDHAVIGPIGSLVMSVFANACAVGAARSSRGRQRLAWIVLAIGVGGWTASNALWCYVSLGGIAPISNLSVANLGYVVFPICALAAAVAIPSRDDSRFGIGLLLDGILIAASLLIVLAILARGHAGQTAQTASVPRMLLITATAVYFALVVMSFILVRKAEPGRKLSATLLAMGYVVIATAGVIVICDNHLYQVPNDLIILGWAGGMYLVTLSGIASRPGPDLDLGFSQPSSRASLWLPYLPVFLAIVVGAVHFWPASGSESFIFGACVVLVLTTLARHLLLLDRKRRLLAAVSDAALKDPVTGLANQRLFDDRLAHAARLHVHHAVPVSILMVSVDDFKLVNETLGYAVGDDLLRSVGERIQANIPARDTVARMTGDEFAILIEERPEVAMHVAEELDQAFDEPLTINDQRLDVRLSIGVASAPAQLIAPLKPDQLLRQAATARQCAQSGSSTNIRIFTPDMDLGLDAGEAYDDGIARLQLLGELRRAIEDGLLNLLYQPKFGMMTGSVCGVEALVRWQHPKFGPLEPSEFLPLVRAHGLMDALTDLVLSRAVADASVWYAAGIPIPIAVNFWAPTLEEDTLPDRIMSVLDAHGMSPSLLTIEITEDLVVADLPKARTVLNQLREAGIRVAIDDFGSGYATLTYLRELPIDDVKLDRQFVAPILHDERAATIARSVIELATEFGIASVAEGVEDWETAQELRSYGCDAVQGNFFCRPLPADEIPHVLPSASLMAR